MLEEYLVLTSEEKGTEEWDEKNPGRGKTAFKMSGVINTEGVPERLERICETMEGTCKVRLGHTWRLEKNWSYL